MLSGFFPSVKEGESVPPIVNLAERLILNTFLAARLSLTDVASSIFVPTPRENSVPLPVPIIA